MGNDASNASRAIGGPVCRQTLDPGMLPGDGQELTDAHREVLWRIFVSIGRVWRNVRFDSSNLKSAWLEMLEAKTRSPPSYVAEYVSAAEVVLELERMYGAVAFRKLFLENGLDPKAPPTTRLAHAKRFVVDEFITAQVMMSGFKHFGGKNYHGYVKGSRYNRLPLVRAYAPHQEGP